MVLKRTRGINLDSWYWQGLMVLIKTRSIDMGSWYWQWSVVLTLTHGIDFESWYSWIKHIQEGRVLPVCGICISINHITIHRVTYLPGVRSTASQGMSQSSILWTPSSASRWNSPLAYQASRYKGWKLMFLIRVFGSYKKLLILIYDSKPNFFFVLFLIMFHGFRFGLCIFSINLTYRCVKCLFHMIN